MAEDKIINMYFATHKTCNLNCSYCYIPPYNRNNQKVEDSIILEALSDFIYKIETEDYKIGSFCFHGTEPTLMEPETLALATNIVMNHRLKSGTANQYSVAIQTNGVKLNRDYLDRLEENISNKKHIKFSFSIDAPKILHDKYRNNSFDKVYENYNLALAKGFSVSILSVVTKDILKHLVEFADFMQLQLAKKIKYGNPYKVKIKFATGESSLSPDEMVEFGAFLKDKNLLGLCQSFSPGYCIQGGNECVWYEFDIEGNCFSCNKALLNDGVFANWKSETFIDIIKKRKLLYSNVFQCQKCSECEFEIFCNGGCPIDRTKSGEYNGLSHECSLIKFVFGSLIHNNDDIYKFIDNNT